MSKLNAVGKVAIVTAAFLVLGKAGNAQTIDTTGFSKIRKFVNSLKSTGPMVDSRFGNPATKQMPGISSGPTPAEIYNSQLSGIADRVNMAIASEIPGIERDLALLEKEGGAYLDPYSLELVKSTIAKKKGSGDKPQGKANTDVAPTQYPPAPQPVVITPPKPNYNGMLEDLAERMSQPGADMIALHKELDLLVAKAGNALDTDMLAEVNRFLKAKAAKAKPAESKAADSVPAEKDSVFVQGVNIVVDTVKVAIDTLKNGVKTVLDSIGITQNETKTATLIKRTNLEGEIEIIADGMTALAGKAEFTAQDSAAAKALIARTEKLETDAREFCSDGNNQDILDTVAVLTGAKKSLKKKINGQ